MAPQQELTESDRHVTIANTTHDESRYYGTYESSPEGDISSRHRAPRTSRRPGGSLPLRATAKAPALNAPGWDETPSYYKLTDKVDGLSEEIRSLRAVVDKLQQGKHEEAALQGDLQKAEDNLTQALENNEELYKKWRKAALQLDKQRSRGVGMGQTSDSDLIESVKQLRYKVERFSGQYFTDTTTRQPRAASMHTFEKYMAEATGSDDYYGYLKSNEKGPSVIQSFIWRLLLGEVLEKFRWASSLQDPMIKVYEALRPAYVDEHGQAVVIAPDAEQRFQTWKATTSALVLEKVRDKEALESENTETKGFSRDFSNDVLKFLRPFAGGPSGALDDLESIIEAAITLDKDICCQTTPIYWGSIPSRSKVPYNADFMRVDTGEAEPRLGQCVDMVTVPALIKRRGDDLNTEDRLVKMTVTCQP